MKIQGKRGHALERGCGRSNATCKGTVRVPRLTPGEKDRRGPSGARRRDNESCVGILRID